MALSAFEIPSGWNCEVVVLPGRRQCSRAMSEIVLAIVSCGETREPGGAAGPGGGAGALTGTGGTGALTGTGSTGALTGTGSTGALTGTGSIGALTGTGSSGLSIAIAISMLVYWTAVVFIHLLSLLPIAVPVAVSPWPPNRFWERTFGSTE